MAISKTNKSQASVKEKSNKKQLTPLKERYPKVDKSKLTNLKERYPKKEVDKSKLENLKERYPKKEVDKSKLEPLKKVTGTKTKTPLEGAVTGATASGMAMSKKRSPIASGKNVGVSKRTNRNKLY